MSPYDASEATSGAYDAREAQPRVLFVYYSHTKQAQRVSEAMAEVLRRRGCD